MVLENIHKSYRVVLQTISLSPTQTLDKTYLSGTEAIEAL
jgi:hypothetical protein